MEYRRQLEQILVATLDMGVFLGEECTFMLVEFPYMFPFYALPKSHKGKTPVKGDQ